MSILLKKSLIVFTIICGILPLGCHPIGAEFAEDTDVVVTKHNAKYNFNVNSTYAMPDKIVKMTGNVQEGIDPDFMPNEYAVKILQRISLNMSLLGYERVDVESDPDMILTPASWQNTTIYYDYWYWWWGSSSYWGYPLPYEESYTTGTLLMMLFNPEITETTGNPVIQWSGAINGLLNGTYSEARVNKSIDQAFIQSPYLSAN